MKMEVSPLKLYILKIHGSIYSWHVHHCILVKWGWMSNKNHLELLYSFYIRFEISKEKFMELKRTANYKAEYILNNYQFILITRVTFRYTTFYVGKLVQILEEVICKYFNNKIKALAPSEDKIKK